MPEDYFNEIQLNFLNNRIDYVQEDLLQFNKLNLGCIQRVCGINTNLDHCLDVNYNIPLDIKYSYLTFLYLQSYCANKVSNLDLFLETTKKFINLAVILPETYKLSVQPMTTKLYRFLLETNAPSTDLETLKLQYYNFLLSLQV